MASIKEKIMYFKVLNEEGKVLNLGHWSNKDVEEFDKRTPQQKTCKIVETQNNWIQIQLGKGEYSLVKKWECYGDVAGHEVKRYSDKCVTINGKKAYDAEREVTYPSETKMVWCLLNKNSYLNSMRKK
jgi:hypothetical protein